MDYHYTYRVEWSTNYDQYVGRCVEVHGLFESAPTAQQALGSDATSSWSIMHDRGSRSGRHRTNRAGWRNLRSSTASKVLWPKWWT